MKRGWLLLLVVSLGLNLGLGITILARQSQPPAAVGCGPFIHPRDAADPSGGHPRGSAEHAPPLSAEMVRLRLDRMAGRLGLSEPQRAEVSAVLAEMLPQLTAQRDIVQATRRDLRGAYRSGTIDPVRIRTLVTRQNRDQALLDSLTAETMLRELEVLTSQQRLQYLQALPWERGMGSGRFVGRGRPQRRGP